MIKTFYRLLIYFFSKFIKTDELSDKFPISIKAIIIDDNKVLCLKNERNEWDFPGGKIEFDEDIELCLKREVMEETNLNINNLNILTPLNLKFNSVPVFILLYSAKISCASPITISYEHSGYDFFSKAEIKNLNIHQSYKDLIEDLI
ncbi:NUDIX hydrolase [Flavobacteriaceae bacterium]|nr:NUDIX hydrolase [Flavobacteriaceae bacterium]MDC0506617.1 NUDIX hydrolase [Flavobacteriaceae bacterium]